MHLSTLVEQLKPRVQRLGLLDPATGFYDVDEVTLYAQDAIRYLANCYQLQHFLSIDRELFRTVADVESYSLPANYGVWAPEETRRSGFSIRDPDDDEENLSGANLEYYDPARYNLYRSNTTGMPAYFTLMGDLMYLQPTPDQVYVVEGIIRPTQDGLDVPEPYVLAVKLETLWRMSSDQNKATPTLLEEHTKVLKTLVNGEMRTRQRFFTSREHLGMGRHRRWG